MRRYEITDQQWAKVADLLPGKVGDVSRSATDNRLFINAVLWIARSGLPGGIYPNALAPGILLIVGLGAGISRGFGKASLSLCRNPI